MDNLAAMLSTIKNSAMAKHESCEFPYTTVKERVANVMKVKGFLAEVRVFKPSGQHFKMIHVDLVYEGGVPKISQVEMVSKPGRRIYKGANELYKTLGGFGISIVSTPRGIMEGSDARRKKLGGEVICKVY